MSNSLIAWQRCTKRLPTHLLQAKAKGVIDVQEGIEMSKAPKRGESDIVSSVDDEFAFLDGYDVPKLSTLIAKATEIRSSKAESEKAAIIEAMKAQMADYGVSQADLFGGPARKPTSGFGASPRRGVAPIKYRGPDGQEWSGRGRVPGWLSELEGQGKKRDEYLIDK